MVSAKPTIDTGVTRIPDAKAFHSCRASHRESALRAENKRPTRPALKTPVCLAPFYIFARLPACSPLRTVLSRRRLFLSLIQSVEPVSSFFASIPCANNCVSRSSETQPPGVIFPHAPSHTCDYPALPRAQGCPVLIQLLPFLPQPPNALNLPLIYRKGLRTIA